MGNFWPRSPSTKTIAITQIYAWFQQTLAPLLLVLAFALFMYHRAYPEKMTAIRTTMVEVVQPVFIALGTPVRTFNQGVAYVQQVASVFQENAALRREVTLLREETLHLKARANENDRLRELLSVPVPSSVQAVTARVIATPDISFMNSFVIWAGMRDGVQKNHAVVTEKGVAGRIVEAGPRVSRVLLLTDISSRVPVYVGTDKIPAIVGGANSAMLELHHVNPQASLKLGDVVVTSGQGGIFPPSLPIGVVQSLAGGVPKVALSVDLDHAEFVKVLDYTAPALNDHP